MNTDEPIYYMTLVGCETEFPTSMAIRIQYCIFCKLCTRRRGMQQAFQLSMMDFQRGMSIIYSYLTWIHFRILPRCHDRSPVVMYLPMGSPAEPISSCQAKTLQSLKSSLSAKLPAPAGTPSRGVAPTVGDRDASIPSLTSEIW